ncbi:MAG TPA: winged helix-turn-helix domain-containing protein [Terriglobales bacterium]|jgi:anti-anti-sigma factor|nr:winged helix-turn-helix domain-containing protein [Terriglobales bacterium]
MHLNSQNRAKYRFTSFEVSVETGELLKHGRRVHLQRKPFEILTALLEQPGKLVSRESLRQRLWPAETFVDFDNGLNTALSKLREALGDTAEKPRYIETLERRGYRFLAPVEEIATPVFHPLRELDVQRKRIVPDVALVELEGKIVYGPECRQLEWLVAELLEEGDRKIIFDLSRVNHVDSTGVGIIVMCSGKVKGAGGELRFVGAEGHVKEVLKLTDVGKILRLYPRRSEALEGFVGTAA